jgi:hypothetical protein
MQTEGIYIVHPATSEEAAALKAFVKALKIKFEVASPTEKRYNPDFVAKIKKSKKDFENGGFTRVKKQDLEQFLGLP